MVRISITIHDLDVSTEQLSAILEGKVEVSLNQAFTCEDCGDTFTSQASVNSHKKNCKVRKAAEAKAKAIEIDIQNSLAEKAAAKAKAKAKAEAKRKAEEEAKKLPSFPGFKDNELEKAVLTVVLECTGAPTTAHSIEEAIWKELSVKYEPDSKLKKLQSTLLKDVSAVVYRIGRALGATEAMTMEAEISARKGAQILIFNSSKKRSINTLLKKL